MCGSCVRVLQQTTPMEVAEPYDAVEIKKVVSVVVVIEMTRHMVHDYRSKQVSIAIPMLFTNQFKFSLVNVSLH